jgi:hypothetical protein
MVLICIGAFGAVKNSLFSTIYSTFVGGILGCLGLYLTGNVASWGVATRNGIVQFTTDPIDPNNSNPNS